MFTRHLSTLLIFTISLFSDNYYVYQGKNSETTVMFHGFGGDYTIADRLRGNLDDTLISFDFPDAGIVEGETDPQDTTFGSLSELKPAVDVLKRCVLEEKRNKINLYGYSAGGGAVINTLAALHSDQDIGLNKTEKRLILEAIQRGHVILDVPLKSLEEVIAFRGANPDLEVIAQRYRENGMRPIDSIARLKNLPLNVVVHFQMPDEILSNKDDQLFINNLKKTNPGHTYAIIGKGEGHTGHHSALWKYYKEKISIAASCETSLIDEPITIEVKGLKPLEEVQLTAQMKDDEGDTWEASGFYLADAHGEIRLDKQASIKGSYIGTDPMGLFWSMKTTSPKTFSSKDDELHIDLKLLRNNTIIATQKLTRLKRSPDVQRIEVNENGIVGVLFLPPSEKPLPTIITLSGASGGFSESRSKLLASHGFAVFALGYFRAEGLPPNLENIPLEYFEKSIAYLKSNPKIGSIGLYGVSRGAELSLILGTMFPQAIKAIAAVSPSSVIYSVPGSTTPAWTFRGKPVGSFLAISEAQAKSGAGKTPDSPISTISLFLKGMQNKQAFEKAIIPVEKITCPLLLISGGADQMWPSTLFARQIKGRLKEKHSKIRCIHLDYARAGHQINIPYLPSSPLFFHPTANLWFSMGGTPQEDEHASRDSWEKLIAFFHTHLGIVNVDPHSLSNTANWGNLRKRYLVPQQRKPPDCRSGPLRAFRARGTLAYVKYPKKQHYLS